MENNTKIIFFDSTWNQLLRFGSNISLFIKETNDNITTIGLLCEDLTQEEQKQEHSFDFIYATSNNLKIAEYVTAARYSCCCQAYCKRSKCYS